MKDVLKYALMRPGGLCVMMPGTTLTLMSHVVSWDIQDSVSRYILRLFLIHCILGTLFRCHSFYGPKVWPGNWSNFS